MFTLWSFIEKVCFASANCCPFRTGDGDGGAVYMRARYLNKVRILLARNRKEADTAGNQRYLLHLEVIQFLRTHFLQLQTWGMSRKVYGELVQIQGKACRCMPGWLKNEWVGGGQRWGWGGELAPIMPKNSGFILPTYGGLWNASSKWQCDICIGGREHGIWWVARAERSFGQKVTRMECLLKGKLIKLLSP